MGDFKEVAALCGSFLEGDQGYRGPENFFNLLEDAPGEVPAEFDVREQWPQCAEVSGHIRDQSACGSCWAFASVEAFNDRLCIATGATKLLSTEDATANCNLWHLCFAFGCNDGNPASAWGWFKRVGVVTGGDYADKGTGASCAPYSLPPYQHFGAHLSRYSTPRPFSSCSESGYQVSFAQDKVRATSAYGLHGVQNVQADIMKYGSVTAAFLVFSDFPTYKQGVYQHHSGNILGGHAVKIIGWGIENSTPYWLSANSWNVDWGDKGFFKILRGQDHCFIERLIIAGHAGSDWAQV